MIKRIHHVAIVVKNLDEALQVYDNMFGAKPSKIETIPDQGVKAALLPLAEGGEIELLEPINPDSGVAKFLETRGEGIHHIAYSVDSAREEIDSMNSKGIRMIDSAPREGAGGTKIAFIHPAASGKVLTELCEHPKSEKEN